MALKACWEMIKNIVSECLECVILIFCPWIHNAVIFFCYLLRLRSAWKISTAHRVFVITSFRRIKSARERSDDSCQ